MRFGSKFEYIWLSNSLYSIHVVAWKFSKYLRTLLMGNLFLRNTLVPSCNKPLPEPMSIKAMWLNVVTRPQSVKPMILLVLQLVRQITMHTIYMYLIRMHVTHNWSQKHLTPMEKWYQIWMFMCYTQHNYMYVYLCYRLHVITSCCGSAR